MIEKVIMQIAKFLNKNKNLLIGLSLAGIYTLLKEKYGYSFKIDPKYIKQIKELAYPNIVYSPKNSVESSILAIYKSAQTMSFDSQKKTAADQIYNIALKDDVDDSTRAYAIDMLSNISSLMSFDSYKHEVNNLIFKINMKKPEVKMNDN